MKPSVFTCVALVPLCGCFSMLAVAQAGTRYQSPAVAPASTAPQTISSPAIPATPAITPNGEVVEDIIVRVNERVISRSDLERSQMQLQQELSQGHPSPEEAEERQRTLLRDMIDQQLLLSKGHDLGINAEADTVRRLDEIRKQNHLDSMEDLEKAARSQGISFEDFKDSVRNGIITAQVVRDEVGRHINVTSADEQRYLDEHAEQFTRPEQVRLSEILVPIAADASETAVAEGQRKADAIEAKLKGGADFAATAKAESKGPTAAEGGDLGFFKRGALAPVLEKATFDLPAGQFTAPIRTRQGFVILQTAQRQAAGVPPLKDVQNQVDEVLYQEMMGPALRAYLTKLREDSYVDIKVGFVDAGASARETKPVFSAYVPPAPKKEKEKKNVEVGRYGQQAQVAKLTPAVVVLDKRGKARHVRREKVRFGQAPRVALPVAPADAVASTPATAGPGAVMAPTELATNENPLTPKTGPKVKTRYSSRQEEVTHTKKVVQQKKAVERAVAKPAAASTDEVTARKVQSAPLGLNGDTTKKKRKRKKGETKERLQAKPTEQKAPLVMNPMLDKKTGLPQQQRPADAAPTKPSADSTTLAPANKPASGDPIPAPAEPGQPSTQSGDPVPLQ